MGFFQTAKKRNTEGRKLYFAVKSFILSTRCIPGLQRREHLQQITHSLEPQAESLLRRQGNNLSRVQPEPSSAQKPEPAPRRAQPSTWSPPQGDPLLPETHPDQGPTEPASLPAWGPDLPERCSLQVTGDGLCPGLSETLQRMRPPLPPTVRRPEHPQSRRPEAAHREVGERRARAGGWKMRAAPDPSEAPGGNRKPRSVYHRQLGPPEFPGPPHALPAAHQSSFGRRENLSGEMQSQVPPAPPAGILCHQSQQWGASHISTSKRSVSRTKAGPLSMVTGAPSPFPAAIPQATSCTTLGLVKGHLASDPPQHHDSVGQTHTGMAQKGQPRHPAGGRN